MGPNIIAALVTLLLAGYYFSTTGTVELNPYGDPSANNKVVLYSINPDGHSQLKRVQLKKQDIKFREVEPMEDDRAKARLEAALVEQKFNFDGLPLVFHLPIVEVNGRFLAKPSINEIWEVLRYDNEAGKAGDIRSWSWSKSRAGTGVSSRRITPLDELDQSNE